MLALDGYYSDITSSNNNLLRVDWIRKYPSLFVSFYFFENPRISRELVRGLDEFVYMICNNMRYTVGALLRAGHRLWDVYIAWHQWRLSDNQSDPYPHSIGSKYNSHLPSWHDRTTSTALEPDYQVDDQLYLFSDFVSIKFGSAITDRVNDEILAFYLRRYHDIEVRQVQQRSHSVSAA